MPELTEIREPNFGLDLPGEWEQGPSDDAATLVFREVSGHATISVTLLRVRPMFEIADKLRLLEDYMSHRQKFEAGQITAIEQSEAVARQVGDAFDGEWSGTDLATGRFVKHRVILVGQLLADFAFEAGNVDKTVFEVMASVVLGSATASE